MKLLGYQFTYSQSPWYIAYNYLVYAFTAWILVPVVRIVFKKKPINIHNISYPFQSVYFVSNINDVFVVCETISLCSGIINAMIKGFVYIRNREKLRRLLIALQCNVDNSRYR